jgi:sec-independent protein translocase protein TatA
MTTAHLALFGPLGTPEMMFILTVFLVLFGAKKIPGLFRSVAQGIGEYKKAKLEFDSEVERAMSDGLPKA